VTTWEERFLSDRHQDLYDKAVWMTDLREVKVREIRNKLGYDRGEVPSAPSDPDGAPDYEDPNGWPPVENVPDAFKDDEQVGSWADREKLSGASRRVLPGTAPVLL